MTLLARVFILFSALIIWPIYSAASLTEDELSHFVIPPSELGRKDENLPVWQVLNSGGALMGYIFETEPLASIPGFSGTPMNMLVHIDTSGNFVNVKVLQQNEPVFVSGLGIRPFREFLRQYRGKSIASNVKVLPAQGNKPINLNAGVNSYIDGVTKATASVRIANETILTSALKVAREKLANITTQPIRRPRQDVFSQMSWQQLIDQGLVKNLKLSNREIQNAFAGTQYSDDDIDALENPEQLYLDIWIADLGLPTVAQNILTSSSLSILKDQLNENEEPLLVVANGRHQLVKDDFVRNSAPNLMSIKQQQFPISLLDADADIEFLAELPDFEQSMVLRIDTRFGFDPSSPWEFIIKATRHHGMFQPEIGVQDLIISHQLDEQYFEQPRQVDNTSLWLAPWLDNKLNILLVISFLILLSYFLQQHRRQITQPKRLTLIRFSLLLFTALFIGWWAQGQLSIVTVLGLIRALFQTHNFTFLLYDPVSLILWTYVLASLVIWGRGTFCGWLCPFGALQEFAFQLGNKLGIKSKSLTPSTSNRLGLIKYFVLAALVSSVFISPSLSDKLVEIEPFKTTITLSFQRDWPYVLYALICILISTVIFKGYCRFLCPLGAALAIGGKLRLFDWLIRRDDCGTPCKLCQVSCQYNAIERDTGNIKYDDCFQCYECVEIYDDEKRCVPLIQLNKKILRRTA